MFRYILPVLIIVPVLNMFKTNLVVVLALRLVLQDLIARDSRRTTDIHLFTTFFGAAATQGPL